MVGFDGTQLDSDLRFLIDSLKVGGIILFSRNLVEPEQIRELTGSAQHHAAKCGQPPLFIAIDQEGGEVARLKAPFTQFPGNPKMKGEKDAARFAEITASELLDAGINMNMAPVLDIAPKGINSVMAGRVFGHDPQWVAQLGTAVISGFQTRRLMAVGKHFPGIGRTQLDSHLEMPDLDADLSRLEETDFVPFRSAMDAGVAGIMLSHIRYSKIDSRWPASLSVQIARELLRTRMGYDGLVMTDDLDMGAIENHYPIRTVVARLLSSDVDIALICHRSSKMETAFEEILNHLRATGEMRQRGVCAVERIMNIKKKYLRG